jgi:hypothetical protein
MNTRIISLAVGLTLAAALSHPGHASHVCRATPYTLASPFESDLSRAIDIRASGDMVAFQRMLDTGRVVWIPEGTSVYLEDRYAQPLKIRQEGDITSYYTHSKPQCPEEPKPPAAPATPAKKEKKR